MTKAAALLGLLAWTASAFVPRATPLIQPRATRSPAPVLASALGDRDDVRRAIDIILGKKEPDWDIDLCSPSKINLFLRIVNRREDG